MNRKIFLSLFLSAVLFTGCSSNLPKPQTPGGSSSSGSSQWTGESAPPPAPDAPASGQLSTGLAIISRISASHDAEGEVAGLGQADSDAVAVLVDADGRIVDCRIDSVQSKLEFSNAGALLGDPAAKVLSKQELGTAYGLSKVSGIGKEWNEQANALSSYVIGKTVDDIKGIQLSEGAAPEGSELSASVTIAIGGYLEAIEKAVNNAKPLGAKAGDQLGLGLLTSLQNSEPAGGDAGEGKIQADTTYAAVTFDEEARITSCMLDQSQNAVAFDTTGKISTDLSVGPPTKRELGDEYGMRKASSIGKEWYEETDAFQRYAVGKTVDELSGIAVTETGVPKDAELSASVTISVGDFQLAIGKAADGVQ